MAPDQNNLTDDKKFPPMVPGHFLLGNLLQLRKRMNDFLVDAVANYGPVFRLKAPGVHVTFITATEGRDLVKTKEKTVCIAERSSTRSRQKSAWTSSASKVKSMSERRRL